MASYLSKQELYESVKKLVETKSETKHIHLNQHKLFTLFSIAFQYMLYCSTKKPGVYLIRVEDAPLVEKLARKSKDPSTKKFIQNLITTRKLKYGKSTFVLDFFNINSWNITSKIPKEKFKAAIIVKNSSAKPMAEETTPFIVEDLESEMTAVAHDLPKNYYRTTLTNIIDRTITIAFDETFEDTEIVRFSFIKDDNHKALSGVKISGRVNLDSLENQ